MLRAAAAAAVFVALGLVVACRSACTDVPAQTRTFTLAPRDAGPDAPGGARPLDECRTLCGDTTPDDPEQTHVTACRVSITDAGDSLVACDETAYRLCAP